VSARRIVLCLPREIAFGDPAPAETAKRDVELVAAWDGTPAGVFGFREGGWGALALAAEHPELVDRLVLVSTRSPGDEPAGIDLDAIRAKTLLLYARDDSDAGYFHGKWWRDQLAARLEIAAGGGDDLLRRLWPRVLSHLAPRTLR
jgi:pimeloyl-ACP methyl ester carboxylesterase